MLPGIIHNPQNNVFTHQVKANVNNLSFGLAADGGAPTFLPDLVKAIDLHIHINPGITVGSAAFPSGSTVRPALHFRLPTGSRIYITNRGTIWGGGGRGGDGDRGRRITPQGASPFVGGGGGGGAGTSSVGGQYSRVDPTGGSFSPDPTDGAGAAPGSTSGGAAGVQDPDEVPGASFGGFVQGAAPQVGGNAISQGGAFAISIFIDNAGGLIYAGANGGAGGYQVGALSNADTIDPEPGNDTATSLTTVTGTSSAAPKAVSYSLSASLIWVANGTYPSVRGVINQV